MISFGIFLAGLGIALWGASRLLETMARYPDMIAAIFRRLRNRS